MTIEQEKLMDYLNWLRSFVVKYKNFTNKTFFKNKISKIDVFNLSMLEYFFNVITLYINSNNLNFRVENNNKEYDVFFNKTYFIIGQDLKNNLIYIKKTEKNNNYWIDLRNLVGPYQANTNNDLNNINLAIGNLLKKGLSIEEIRKILDDYLNAYEKGFNYQNERKK